MGSVILSFFQLVLGVSSKLALNAIDKCLAVREVFLEKSFELKLRDRSGVLVTAIVLSPSEVDSVVEEYGSK